MEDPERRIGEAGQVTGKAGEEDSGESMIAERLNRLFATVHPPGRGPYLLREVADAINAEAGERVISPAYLSMLRRGQRAEPSHSRLAAIARFFGVDVDYFSDMVGAAATDRQLEFLAAMRDAGVRSVALRAQGLSEASLAAVRAVIENARRLEGLPDRPGEEEPERPSLGPGSPALRLAIRRSLLISSRAATHVFTPRPYSLTRSQDVHPYSLRDQCVQRLRGIDIPRPFCLDAFAATVGAYRRRRLQVLPLPGLDGSDCLSGAWIATDTADLVLIDADASPWHRDLIGLHEISHILCDHADSAPTLRNLAEDLLPALSDVTVRRMLGRHGYSCQDEQQAEFMACHILERADADPLSVSLPGPAGAAGRLAHALRHPVRHA